ncbi:MAG: DarT ssDNA thymidine ADP-ribosyltransferase family protein [Fusobacteriaceae bacterium]
MHHLTPIDNLASILSKGILARNSVNNFSDTADPDIIQERKNIGGLDLNNFVPFHLDFLQKDHEISYNHIVLRNNGKENMVFIISTPEKLKCTAINMIYFLYHPASNYAKKFLKWADYSKTTTTEYKTLKKENKGKLNYRDNRTQQFLMSEILVPDFFKIKNIEKLIVFGEVPKKRVEKILDEYNVDIEVEIDKKFFGR